MKKTLKKLPVVYYEERDRWSGPESLNYTVCASDSLANQLVAENKASHTAACAPEYYILATNIGLQEVSDELYEAVLNSKELKIITEPTTKALLLWTNKEKEEEKPVNIVPKNKRPLLPSVTPSRKEVETYLADLAAYEQYLKDELEALK